MLKCFCVEGLFEADISTSCVNWMTTTDPNFYHLEYSEPRSPRYALQSAVICAPQIAACASNSYCLCSLSGFSFGLPWMLQRHDSAPLVVVSLESVLHHSDSIPLSYIRPPATPHRASRLHGDVPEEKPMSKYD